MIIKLINNVNIDLKWSFLVLEYLEEYPGGIKQLKADAKAKRNIMKLQNHLIYSAIRGNYDEPLSYNETIRLFQMSDLPKITKFFEDKLVEQNEFQKKNQYHTTRKKKKKK